MHRSLWKVLLIEDSERFARQLRGMLSSTGLAEVEIRWANRLSTGLEMLREESPDVILCDLGLPDSQGLETLRAVAVWAPEIPIIVLTGEDEGELGEAAMREGAEDFLSKAEFDRRLLERTVHYAAERRRLEREIRKREEKLGRSAERLRSLVELGQRRFESEKALLAYALEEAVRITGSRIGYLHLVGNNLEEMELFCWSEEVKKTCAATTSVHYPLAQAGVWADCLRLGHPVIHNDYPKDDRRQCLPEGHAPLRRHMSVVVKDQGRAAAICGVANKDRDYDEPDALELELFMDGVWKPLERMRSEQALRESEARYRNLFELESDAMFLIDAETGSILEANSAAEVMYGYGRDELLLMRNFDLSAEPDQTRTAVDSGLRHVPIRRHRKKNGVVFPVEITGSYFELKGRRTHIAAVRDIAERREAEESLCRSREFLFLVLNSLSAHIAVLDGEGRIVEVNEAWRCFGRENGLACSADCVGVNYLKVCDDVRGQSSEGAAEAAAGIREVLAGKRELFLHEYPCHGPEVKRWFDLRVTAFTVGGATMAIAVHEDMTERRMLEARLRETEERYRALFERSMDLLYVADLSGDFIDANPAALRLLGYDHEEIISLNFVTLLDPDQLSRAFESMKEMMRTGSQREMDLYRLRTKEGPEIEVETIGVLLYRDGQPFAIQGIARDVTERKRLERELREYREQLERLVEERTGELRNAQEELVRKERLAALGQLAGSIGHEILNPLGVIKNSVYYLNLVLKNPGERTKRHLEIMDREIDRSRRIVQDLLNLTRTGPRRRMKIDLALLVDEAIDEVQLPDWIELRRDYQPGLTQLAVDPDQLKQVFLNLLRNACQSMELSAAGRSLRVFLGRDGEGLKVRFEDSGAGIAPEVLGRIFEPLVSTKTHGFGLGLTVSRQLARLNGGEIEAENLPGGGAGFTVRFRPELDGAAVD